jgi:hypothetical protein
MGKMKNIDKSIEELVQEHNIRMRDITGNPNYQFSKLDLVMYLSYEEARARSTPVVMRKTCDEIRLGEVWGPDEPEISKSSEYKEFR